MQEKKVRGVRGECKDRDVGKEEMGKREREGEIDENENK
jgi:hypothetical protein